MNSPDESLLLRWSRRKQEARQQEAPRQQVAEPAAPVEEMPRAVEPASEPAGQLQQTAAVPDEGAGEPAAPEVDEADLDLPDVETLTYESDFTTFLRDGVPERLKQAALRKLWLSDPVFANLDGLNDYDPKTMKFLEEAVGEPIAEVGRAMRDKIMEAKRATVERPRGPRRRPAAQQAAERRVDDAAPVAADQNSPIQNSSIENDDVGDGDIAGSDERHDS